MDAVRNISMTKLRAFSVNFLFINKHKEGEKKLIFASKIYVVKALKMYSSNQF